MGVTLISQNAVPIIDMAYIRTNDVWPIKSCTRQSALKLCKALSEHGLALLVNHGITETKLQRAYYKLEYFSNLSKNVKYEFEAPSDLPGTPGYFPAGPKIVGELVDFRHLFNIRVNSRDEVPCCFDTNNLYSTKNLINDFQSLASTLLQFIAIGMGVSPKELRHVYDKIVAEKDESYFQLQYYPPTDDCVPQDEKYTSEYVEKGMFVLVAQDSECGLQILNSSKKWVTVGYLPGAILLICGYRLKEFSEKFGNPVPFRFSVPVESNTRSRSRHSAILTCRLPLSALELCPVFFPQQRYIQARHCVRQLSDQISNDSDGDLSLLQRVIDFFWRNCRLPFHCPT